MRRQLVDFAGGAFIGAIVGWIAKTIGGSVSYFTLGREISLVELATLLLTAYAALILFRSAERVKYADQLRKDTLLRRLESVRSASKRSAELVAADHSPTLVEVTSASKAVGTEMQLLKSAFARLDVTIESEAIDKAEKALRVQHRLMTYTPPGKSAPDSPLRVVSNQVLITAGRRREIESQCRVIDSLLFEIEAQIICF